MVNVCLTWWNQPNYFQSGQLFYAHTIRNHLEIIWYFSIVSRFLILNCWNLTIDGVNSICTVLFPFGVWWSRVLRDHYDHTSGTQSLCLPRTLAMQVLCSFAWAQRLPSWLFSGRFESHWWCLGTISDFVLRGHSWRSWATVCAWHQTGQLLLRQASLKIALWFRF